MKPTSFRTLLLFFLLLGWAGLSAQVERLDVVKNEAVTYTFLSRVQPVIGRSPNQGTAVIEAEDNVEFSYVLTYTPDQDYVGTDNFLLVSFPFGLSVAFTNFEVDVQEATIRANHDFATTTVSTPVAVPVMENDSVNVGGITLTTVPVVNGGTATVEGNNILFTPDPGFVGLTDLNYVICSDFGACDLGTVSVSVLGEATTDTVRVFTRRDEPQFIFAPQDAAPLTEPTSGEMVDINGVMGYRPDPGFVGDETLTYQTPDGNTTVFQVTVLDLEANQFAVEDRAFTAIDRTTTINVLRNDLYGVFTDCISFGAPRFGILRPGNRDGEVLYTPPAGWIGVDEFTYQSSAPGCGGDAETETVYVFVSDFAPAAAETVLTTPAGTPVALTYAVPGDVARWSVIEQPNHGTLINDPLTGELKYLPNPTAAGRADEVALNYCLTAQDGDDCERSVNLVVAINVTAADPNACIDDDCVWPGDTNNDGVVDVDDLLPIGLAMGANGTPRPVGNPSSWSAQYSLDWGQDLNGLDYKYIDANGDRFVSALDTQVVMANLGKGHRLRPAPVDFTTFDLSIIGPQEVEPGDLIRLQIVAGSEVVGVEDVFGFRFTFDYDNTIINPNTVEIAFDEESWMGYDSPILSLAKNDVSSGLLTAAVTRTGRDGISGFGPIGSCVVGVEDVFGFFDRYDGPLDMEQEMITTIGGTAADAVYTNAAGHTTAVRVNPFDLKIKRKPATEVGGFAPAEAQDFLDRHLLAFPNPTDGRLTVHLNSQQQFTGLQLIDMTGRAVRQLAGLNTNHHELDVSDLPNGLYTLTLTTEAGVVNRKIKVAR